MRTILQDLRFALRQLLKMPGFTTTAIVSLGLGIGATTAVFSVVYAILMDPYPYAAPDRMVHMRFMTRDGGTTGFGLTGTQWQHLRKSPVVEDSFLEDDWRLTVTGSDVPEDVQGVYLSTNAFEFLGVPAVLGRGLQPSDAVDGQDPQPVVVLSYSFWQRHYQNDPGVIGRTIQLVRKNYTVVGVAASRFTWGDADVYLPLKISGDAVKGYYAGVRLKPGVTHAQADGALAPLIQQFANESPKHFPDDHGQFHVVGLNEDFIRQLGGTMALLFGGVALLLLIGCGNVSILLLARATARQHEFAVRSAIGASRGRIIRQLLTESLLLALSGTALGLMLAYGIVGMIVAHLPEYSFPHEAAIQINVPVLIFSILVAFGTGILFGLWPALQLSRPEVSQVMQSSTRKVTGTVAGHRVHNLLIGGQVALTLVMLAAAGAAIEGFLRLARARLGYDPHNVMSVGIPVHDGAYTTWSERAAFFQRMHDEVATVPGVKMVAISSNATPPASGYNTRFEIMGQPSAHDQELHINLVSREYFPVLKVPLIQGKVWENADEHRGAALALVNLTLARRYFPNGDALGHSIKLPRIPAQAPYVLMAPGSDGWILIIGVVGDKLDDGLAKPIVPEAYVPYTTVMGMFTQILVRSEVPPLQLLHSVQMKVKSIDAEQQTLHDSRDLEHWISRMPEYARGQLVSWLFGAFAILALVLAGVGLYSVVSYTVVQRTSEFGIRIALGAKRGHVMRIVFNSTVLSVGAGIIAGLGLAFALNRLFAQWASESAHDPLMLFGATWVLATVATLACAIPAWRAAGVSPMIAIRYE